MIIKVTYCKKMRKDGSYNEVVFDTDAKQILHGGYDVIIDRAFVEAAISSDVDNLRMRLYRDGYTDRIIL